MTHPRRRDPVRTDAPSKRGRAPRSRPSPSSSDVEAARRYGLVLAAVFVVVGILLLVLSALGRGWPYLLGAIDFLVIGAVLGWVARGAGRPRSAG